MLIEGFKPKYSRETQLVVITQLARLFRRVLRHNFYEYSSNLEQLRLLYSATRDGIESRSGWSFSTVETALAQRGLGPAPLPQEATCKCVPYPGAWMTKTQSTVSHWHDRQVRFCKTCSMYWTVVLPRARWYHHAKPSDFVVPWLPKKGPESASAPLGFAGTSSLSRSSTAASSTA